MSIYIIFFLIKIYVNTQQNIRRQNMSFAIWRCICKYILKRTCLVQHVPFLPVEETELGGSQHALSSPHQTHMGVQCRIQNKCNRLSIVFHHWHFQEKLHMCHLQYWNRPVLLFYSCFQAGTIKGKIIFHGHTIDTNNLSCSMDIITLTFF